MSKRRQVAYVKPNEPAFLKKLKLEAGYQEGPTVDTKREDLAPPSLEDSRDLEDELPTVVVLEKGDLTAEEAERLRKEKEEAPADLSERIIFKPRSSSVAKPKPKKNKTALPVLSFNHEEEEEGEDD